MHRPPLLPGDVSGAHLYGRLSRPQSLSAAGMVKSIYNYKDPVGNQTRDLSACLNQLRHRLPENIVICNKRLSVQ